MYLYVMRLVDDMHKQKSQSFAQIASEIHVRHACWRRCRPMKDGGLASDRGTRICFQAQMTSFKLKIQEVTGLGNVLVSCLGAIKIYNTYGESLNPIRACILSILPLLTTSQAYHFYGFVSITGRDAIPSRVGQRRHSR